MKIKFFNKKIKIKWIKFNNKIYKYKIINKILNKYNKKKKMRISNLL